MSRSRGSSPTVSGCKAEVKAPFPDRVAAEIGKNWLTGLQSMGHSWGLALADAAAGTRTVYDGMNGSGLLGGSRLASIERTLFPGAIVPPAWRLRRDRVIDAIVNEDAIRVLPDFLTRPKTARSSAPSTPCRPRPCGSAATCAWASRRRNCRRCRQPGGQAAQRGSPAGAATTYSSPEGARQPTMAAEREERCRCR